MTDLMAGRVDLMVDNLITALPQIRAGKVVPIAVTSRERIAELPNVPSLAESGYPDLEVAVWLGIFVSSKTPPATVTALNEALQKVLSSAEIRDQFAKSGGVAVGGTPSSFQTFVAAETQRWAKVIRTADIKVD
jgi:tripartite-type tricarboxylate transporter receptor subunit TctC